MRTNKRVDNKSCMLRGTGSVLAITVLLINYQNIDITVIYFLHKNITIQYYNKDNYIIGKKSLNYVLLQEPDKFNVSGHRVNVSYN